MVFSLTPAQNVDGVLDFDDKAHRAIYDKSITALPINPFDCDNTQLVDFMSSLSKKAHDFGWTDRILKIPLTLPEDQDTEYVNLLTNHAQISIDKIREYELTYVGQTTRERQDMHCLYTCIINSLSQEGRTKILTEKEKYQIPSDPNDEDSDMALSGNLLLKVVLMKSTVDNRSGAYSIRMQLSNLPELIVKLDYDIEKFNLQVKQLLEGLNRRGESSDDLTYNLLESYRRVPVKEFTSFIDRVKDEVDDRPDDDQKSPHYIMDKAENKFKTLVNEGIWNAKMNDKDEILALKAEIKKLKKISNGGRAGGNSNKGTKSSSSRKRVDITRKPKDITKPVIIDGKEWYWCCKETGGKCTGALRRHKPSECKGFANSAGTKDESKKRPSKPNSDSKKKKLKLKANETLMQGEGSDSDISREDFNEEDET